MINIQVSYKILLVYDLTVAGSLRNLSDIVEPVAAHDDQVRAIWTESTRLLNAIIFIRNLESRVTPFTIKILMDSLEEV